MTVKQVIVMRTDTTPPMRKGKMIAQGAHASMSFLTKHIRQNWGRDADYNRKFTNDMLEWLGGDFTKICLKIDSEEGLLQIHDMALTAGLESHLITDSGKTEFSGPTNTCVAIGPNKSESIDAITGDLKLL